jgi:ribA/ribD-fused uncharacterized protein
VIKGDKGVILETIELPPYRAPTLSERAEQEATHTRDLRAAEKAFEAAKADLRSQDWEHWDTHVADIRMSMLAVERADQALQQIRFPLMAMQTFKSLRTNLIDFSKPKDVHMLKDVHIVITRPRTLEEEYVRTTPLPTSTVATTDAGAAAGAGAPKAPVVLIDSTSELSGWAHHDVVVNGVTYPTSYHALMAEVAASFGDEALAETVRATEAPADVSVTLDALSAFGATEESWNAKRSELLPPILEEQCKANPGMADALLQTGTAPLGYVPPDDSTDMLMGIGFDSSNPAARDSTKWTGQNLYGKILEKVRADLVIQRRTMTAQTPVFVLANPTRTLRIANVAKQPTAAPVASVATVASVASVVSDAASSVASAAKPVANAISSAASSAASTASSAASSVASTASSAASGAASVASNAASSVASTVSSAASTVADAAKPAINAVRSLFP